MYIFLAGLLLVQFIFIFGYYFLYSPDLYVRPSNDIYIHPIEKTLSGKKFKSLTIRPNGALGSVKTCLYSKAFALYNITGCLFFKLSWKENILSFKKRNPVTSLPLSSSEIFIVSHFPSFILFIWRFSKRAYIQLHIPFPVCLWIVFEFFCDHFL